MKATNNTGVSWLRHSVAVLVSQLSLEFCYANWQLSCASEEGIRMRYPALLYSYLSFRYGDVNDSPAGMLMPASPAFLNSEMEPTP